MNEYVFVARSLPEPIKANGRTMAVASHYDARCIYMYSYVSEGEDWERKTIGQLDHIATLLIVSSTIVRKVKSRSSFLGVCIDWISTEKFFKEETNDRQPNRWSHEGS
jgi:hypothetical protein